jgi:nitrogenase subunit NifH
MDRFEDRMRMAVYCKGGIGKSTITSNLSYSLSKKGYKVVQIGCDPKCDSTRPLLNGRYQRTVTEYIRELPPSKRRLEDIVSAGSNGVLCIEAGGPRPGTGCAGKGIISMFSTLEKMGAGRLESDGHRQL